MEFTQMSNTSHADRPCCRGRINYVAENHKSLNMSVSRRSTIRKSTKIGIDTQLSMHISEFGGTVGRKTQPNTGKFKKSKTIFAERTAKEVN